RALAVPDAADARRRAVDPDPQLDLCDDGGGAWAVRCGARAERGDGPRAADHFGFAGTDDALAPARRGSVWAAVPSLGAPRRRSDRRCAALAGRGRRGAGRPELWDDRDVLADRHVREAVTPGRGAGLGGRGDRAGPDGLGGRTERIRLAAH